MDKQFRISGMDCTSCANLITKHLKKLPGVEEANVNFATEKAMVHFDPKQMDEQKIIEEIKHAGYRAELVTTQDPEKDRAQRQQETDVFFRKFLIGAVLSSPFLYFMLMDMMALPGGMILSGWMGVISLALSIPVQFYLGASFYKGAWSSLRMKTFNMDSLIAIGTSAAFFYSVVNFVVYAVQNNSLVGVGGESIPELYFETAVFLITFVLLGKWLE